jgi:hypothetical protein
MFERELWSFLLGWEQEMILERWFAPVTTGSLRFNVSTNTHRSDYVNQRSLITTTCAFVVYLVYLYAQCQGFSFEIDTASWHWSRDILYMESFIFHRKAVSLVVRWSHSPSHRLSCLFFALEMQNQKENIDPAEIDYKLAKIYLNKSMIKFWLICSIQVCCSLGRLISKF